MRSGPAFLIGVAASSAGAAAFFFAGRLVAAGAQARGDFLGVSGMLLGLIGLYFLILGALRLKGG